MSTLQFKRGLKANLPTSGASGEPIFCTDTSELLIGTGSSVVAPTVGTAVNATKLLTARTISATGDITGSGNFDGSANLPIAMTLSTSGVSAGTYKSVTVDVKGRVTGGTNPTTLAGYGITDGVSTVSPAFSGIPTTPTATTGTNTTQIASTAFVNASISAIATIDGGTF